MNPRCLIAIAAAVIVLLPFTAAQTTQPAAGVETYRIDPVHSNTWFRIRHLNISNFYGRFNDTAGTIVLDSANPANCSFEARIAVDSIDTHNVDRDKDLKSANFFEVEKYPQIAFKSTAVKKTGEQTYEVTGDLTLHGVTRPLTLKIEQTGSGPAMKGEHRAGFETTFEIKRSDFGMTHGLAGVGDEVRLTVSVEAIRQ
jgi:polyisoprenoid-binding protein YceI